jgi:hypothetical protein
MAPCRRWYVEMLFRAVVLAGKTQEFEQEHATLRIGWIVAQLRHQRLHGAI